MSFINSNTKGHTYTPGWFLANNEDVTRLTAQIEADASYVKKDENGGAYAPMGAVYPANDGTATGIIYEDVDVSNGNMPGSLVMSGVVYRNRLFEELNGEAETALAGNGFVFIDEEEVERPY